jgi:flagellar hook assembly protein FlgD
MSEIGTFTLDPPLEIHGVVNFPNPFKADTRIRYKLSKSVNRVRVVIYTIGGAFVRELEGDTAATSLMREYHDVLWDGRNAAGEQVVNGVYLYKVIAEGHGETKEASNRMFRLR